MHRIYPVLIISLLLAIAAAGCVTTSPSPSSDDRLVIAVSIVPEETFVYAVAGDQADVIVMIPPGHSPENYEPTPVQMQTLGSADIYFAIGVQAEDTTILPSVSPDTKLVRLQDAVSAAYPDRTIGSERDPHIWLSPKRAVVMVNEIAAQLSALDPHNSSVYRENAAAYIRQLSALDTDLHTLLDARENKKFMVYHPAFGYFADDYGITMYALEEDGKEATIQHLEEMIDLARRENINVLFYQDEVDSSQSAAFAEEIGGKTFALSPLAADYTANLRSMAQAVYDAGAA